MKQAKKEYLQKWKLFYNFLRKNPKIDGESNDIPLLIVVRLFIVLYIRKELPKIDHGHSNLPSAQNFFNNDSYKSLLDIHQFLESLNLNLVFGSNLLFETNSITLFEQLYQLKEMKNFLSLLDDANYYPLLRPEFLGILYESLLTKGKKLNYGIFYTPSNIVEYMTQSSLYYYLSNDTYYSYEKLQILVKSDKSIIKNKIRSIKVLDPSCGSGIFLTSFFKLLVAIQITVFPNDAKSKIQNEIITSNLFGVDINQDSISITKLILQLSSLENDLKDLKYPELISNLVVANSLSNKLPFPEESFDIVIGNPPWGISIKNQEEKPNYGSLFQGQYDSAIYFMYHYLQDFLGKPNGILSLVLPNEITLSDSYGQLRKILLDHTLKELIYLGNDVFTEVTRPGLIITLVTNPDTKENYIRTLPFLDKNLVILSLQELDKFIDTNSVIIDQSTFNEPPLFRLNIWKTLQDREILHTHFNLPDRIKNFLINGRGVDTNRTGTYIICPSCTYLNPPFGVGNASKISEKSCVNQSCTKILKRNTDYKTETLFSENQYSPSLAKENNIIVPGIIGSDLQRFKFKSFRACYYYGDKVNQQEFNKYSYIGWKNHNLYMGEKILLRKVSTGLLPIVNYHNGFLLFNQQVYCFKLKNDIKIDILYFFALISSRLFYYYQLQHTDPNKKVLSHFTQKDILEFPIPVPDSKEDKYQDLLNLIRNFLNLIEKMDLKEAERVYNEYDELVFSFYRINKDETVQYIKDFVGRHGFVVFSNSIL